MSCIFKCRAVRETLVSDCTEKHKADLPIQHIHFSDNDKIYGSKTKLEFICSSLCRNRDASRFKYG